MGSTVYDYMTGREVRPATAADRSASDRAAAKDGGGGVYVLDSAGDPCDESALLPGDPGRSVYVS